LGQDRARFELGPLRQPCGLPPPRSGEDFCGGSAVTNATVLMFLAGATSVPVDVPSARELDNAVTWQKLGPCRDLVDVCTGTQPAEHYDYTEVKCRKTSKMEARCSYVERFILQFDNIPLEKPSTCRADLVRSTGSASGWAIKIRRQTKFGQPIWESAAIKCKPIA
jgi:hypothetical protein